MANATRRSAKRTNQTPLRRRIPAWAMAVWKWIAALLVIDGLFSLIRDVHALAVAVSNVYSKFIAPVDFGGILRSAVLGSIELYRNLLWPFLDWLQPASRDLTIIFLCVYGPQIARIIRYALGVRLQIVTENPGWRFRMELLALTTVSFVGLITSVGFVYDVAGYKDVVNIVLWWIPLYVFHLWESRNTDFPSPIRVTIVITIWSVVYWIANWIAWQFVTVGQLSSAVFIASFIGLHIVTAAGTLKAHEEKRIVHEPNKPKAPNPRKTKRQPRAPT